MPITHGGTSVYDAPLFGQAIKRIYAGERVVFDKYAPNGVVFDGSTYLSRSAPVGAADSNKFTFSAWMKAATDASSLPIMSMSSGFSLTRTTPSATITVFGAGGGATRLNLRTTSSALAVADGWRHVIMSFDLSDTAKRRIYVDDANMALTVTTYSNANIAFATGAPPIYIGANFTATSKYSGSMAEVWFQPGTYLDLTDESVRRKFITADGKPECLGLQGQRPTGSAPLLYLGSRDVLADTWPENRGTGGDLSAATGTLTDDAIPPTVAG
ncbi:MAG: LamG-like jellyroll fold domain-containing protein [Pontixanthobacter sp.]